MLCKVPLREHTASRDLKALLLSSFPQCMYICLSSRIFVKDPCLPIKYP
jgi:hypothetical protein